MQSSSSASDASGNAGAQGAVEQIDSHVPGATVDHWAPYRSFVFDDGRAVIRAADERQITDTAAYLARNPSLRLGINDSMDVENTSASEQRLGERRVAAVRDALIRAGTPADRIETGAFGDPKRRRNQRVGVFLLTPQ
jgi:outer membrane protein OmpA-like peptidoglycan-associated protein